MTKYPYYIDTNDEGLITMSLTNSPKRVCLEENDLEELLRLNVSVNWMEIGNRVVVKGRQGKNPYVNVARLILDADKGIQVRFKDRDPYNLTRDNLIKFASNAKYRARDQLNG